MGFDLNEIDRIGNLNRSEQQEPHTPSVVLKASTPTAISMIPSYSKGEEKSRRVLYGLPRTHKHQSDLGKQLTSVIKPKKAQALPTRVEACACKQTSSAKHAHTRTPSMADVTNPNKVLYILPARPTNPNYVRCKVAKEPFDVRVESEVRDKLKSQVQLDPLREIYSHANAKRGLTRLNQPTTFKTSALISKKTSEVIEQDRKAVISKPVTAPTTRSPYGASRSTFYNHAASSVSR